MVDRDAAQEDLLAFGDGWEIKQSEVEDCHPTEFQSFDLVFKDQRLIDPTDVFDAALELAHSSDPEERGLDISLWDVLPDDWQDGPKLIVSGQTIIESNARSFIEEASRSYDPTNTKGSFALQWRAIGDVTEHSFASVRFFQTAHVDVEGAVETHVSLVVPDVEGLDLGFDPVEFLRELGDSARDLDYPFADLPDGVEMELIDHLSAAQLRQEPHAEGADNSYVFGESRFEVRMPENHDEDSKQLLSAAIDFIEQQAKALSPKPLIAISVLEPADTDADTFKEAKSFVNGSDFSRGFTITWRPAHAHATSDRIEVESGRLHYFPGNETEKASMEIVVCDQNPAVNPVGLVEAMIPKKAS